MCAGYLSLSGGTTQASKTPVPTIRGIARAKAYRRRPYPMGMLLKTVIPFPLIKVFGIGTELLNNIKNAVFG